MFFLKKELKKKIKQFKRAGKKIVFTNGCYDIIHVGHIRLLKKAAAMGDVLVVALNSDSSVRKIKGPSRPLTPQKERAELLASFYFVDAVTVFYEENPYNIIKEIKPDVLVKGGDWEIKDIIGADIVRAGGGRVRSIKYEKGKSTTNIIKKIMKS
ncbi:MAG TPA: D-glycero-beta-D-manno-heptose 1-phosphate adenylyltransferase, partial [Firmicutes bacterium]|nr:D-glycero-beta-D-manno-heptose 1-phosphate adenylyltransferase [Bacillota bacterium]